jgi:hypothetical protein
MNSGAFSFQQGRRRGQRQKRTKARSSRSEQDILCLGFFFFSLRSLQDIPFWVGVGTFT